MPPKIILDQATFKALATESRISILKHLKSRRYMQSELAKLLDLAVPTVKEHLDAMDKAGLVLRIDEGRKWKYYELSPKGRALLAPEEESQQLWVMLSVTSLAVLGGLAGLIRSRLAPYFSGEVYSGSQGSLMSARSLAPDAPASNISPEMATAMKAALPSDPSLWANPWFWVYVGVLVLLVLWTVVKLVKYRRAKAERDSFF